MKEWIERLLADPELVQMGHEQRAADANLGMGWIYYALARALRPARAVVIGSWRGFVPLVIGKALSDNGEGGEVVFIDPSLVDDFWRDAGAVAAHFARHGVANIRHHLATTQEFVSSDAFRELDSVGILFIDGLHTAKQARFDHEAFHEKLAPGALVLFHDSLGGRTSTMYGKDRAYEVDVNAYIDTLRADPRLQLFDVPLGSGLTLLRRREAA